MSNYHSEFYEVKSCEGERILLFSRNATVEGFDAHPPYVVSVLENDVLIKESFSGHTRDSGCLDFHLLRVLCNRVDLEVPFWPLWQFSGAVSTLVCVGELNDIFNDIEFDSAISLLVMNENSVIQEVMKSFPERESYEGEYQEVYSREMKTKRIVMTENLSEYIECCLARLTQILWPETVGSEFFPFCVVVPGKY